MDRINKLLALPKSERILLVKAALILSGIGLGLRMIPFASIRRLVTGLSEPPRSSGRANRFSPDKIAWAVTTASRHVPGAHKCLSQALAVRLLLGRQGYPASLRIGVAKSEEGWLQAHAWVESGGEVVVGGAEHDRYMPLPSLEGGRG